MKLRLSTLPFALILLPLWAPGAAVDYFLKIDGIDGESKDPKHRSEIDVLSWNWGMGRSCQSESNELPAVQNINFSFKVNKATPKLMLACATGQHIPEAKLICRKAGGDQQEFMTIKLSDVLISSFQTGGTDPSGEIPQDQIAICFGGIRITNLRYDDEGNLVEVVTEGFATTRDGVIPDPDDYPGVAMRIMDTIAITGPAVAPADTTVE